MNLEQNPWTWISPVDVCGVFLGGLHLLYLDCYTALYQVGHGDLTGMMVGKGNHLQMSCFFLQTAPAPA